MLTRLAYLSPNPNERETCLALQVKQYTTAVQSCWPELMEELPLTFDQ